MLPSRRKFQKTFQITLYLGINGPFVKKMITFQQIINESREINLKNNQTASPDAHVKGKINQVMKNMH